MPGNKGGGGGGGKKKGPTEGDDLIIGSKRADTIDALGGDDQVIAGKGDDIVHGGDDNDELYGGSGDDWLYGDEGDDFLAGNVGSDHLFGGSNTEEGRDIASYTGDPPTDGAEGGYVFDATGVGAYTVTGGGYTDYLVGIEEIWGSNLDDIFNGGVGDEVFDGRLGNDEFTGDVGADTFIFGHLDGLDTITDFDAAEGDQIDLSVSVLDWSDLDTNGDNALDDADAFVSIVGGATVIDLGAAAGYAPGENVLTLDGAVGLIEDDFIFV